MPNNSKAVENLSKMLKPESEVKAADAAVALVLRHVNRDFQILLVKRIESPSDPWSGQMAFPGGKRDSKDRDIKQTVVRETLEETNINLARRCRFLGVLENTRSSVNPKLVVTPFVALLEHNPTIMLNRELEGYLWVSLKKLRESRGTARFSFGEVPAYFVEGNVVWGLTHGILEKFIQIFEHATQKNSPL